MHIFQNPYDFVIVYVDCSIEWKVVLQQSALSLTNLHLSLSHNVRYSIVLARFRSNPDVKRTGNNWSKPLVCFTSEEVCNFWLSNINRGY